MSNPLIESDGSKRWWLNGQRHRVDGPAVEYSDGDKEWWLNSQKYNEEEFALLQLMKTNLVVLLLRNGRSDIFGKKVDK